jgi:NAD(P)-dependent dehydrogenase (short-subunit alcohol dehydrogenase family)
MPLGRILTPREVAMAAVYLASEESAMMTGAELRLDGGYTAR